MSAPLSPLDEIRDARLGFRLAFQTIYADPPWQIVRLIPEFPEVRADIEEKTDVVWDLPQLCDSIRKPGGYHVLNCSCGLSDHAGLNQLAFVSHPDDETVVWEIDIHDHRPALHERWGNGSGFLRLIFRRTEYEADIRVMLDAVLSSGDPTLPPVEEYAPDNKQGEAYEWLQSWATANDWSRQPILPKGTTLEFLPDTNRLRDGKPLREYVPCLLTRWAAMQAYQRWTHPFWRNAPTPPDPISADANGQTFAIALQACYAEGRTAPGVTVSYCPADRACEI
jgi:hypothetical protein